MLSINADIEGSVNGDRDGKLPPIETHTDMGMLHSDNALIGKFAVRSKVFEMNAAHISPRELLQDRLI